MRASVKILAVIGLLAACQSTNKQAPQIGSAPAPAQAGNLKPADASAGNVKGFLSGDALKAPPALKPLSGDAIGQEINLDDYTLPTDDDTSGAGNTDCTKQRAGNVQASKDAVWISTNVDVTDCVNTGATNAKYLTATLSLVMLLRCPGVDLSSHDGAPYGTVTSAWCKGAQSVQGLLNAQISGPYAVTGAQGSLTANVTFMSTTMTDDGLPCVKSWSGDQLTVQPCTFITSTQWTNVKDTSPTPASNLNTYKLRKETGLSGKKGHKFYASGSYQLQIGNWAGTVTYGNADSAPTWTMANNGQTVKGVWQDLTQPTSTATSTSTGN